MSTNMEAYNWECPRLRKVVVDGPAERPSISSALVLAADDPAALAQFYGALLDAKPQPGFSSTHWRVPWPAGGWLEVYSPSRNRPQPRQQGRLALCLQRQRQADGPGALADLQAWISTGLDLGATAEEPPRQEPFGAEAWLLDPEGNRLLLLVLICSPSSSAGDLPQPGDQPTDGCGGSDHLKHTPAQAQLGEQRPRRYQQCPGVEDA